MRELAQVWAESVKNYNVNGSQNASTNNDEKHPHRRLTAAAKVGLLTVG